MTPCPIPDKGGFSPLFYLSYQFYANNFFTLVVAIAGNPCSVACLARQGRKCDLLCLDAKLERQWQLRTSLLLSLELWDGIDHVGQKCEWKYYASHKLVQQYFHDLLSNPTGLVSALRKALGLFYHL